MGVKFVFSKNTDGNLSAHLLASDHDIADEDEIMTERIMVYSLTLTLSTAIDQIEQHVNLIVDQGGDPYTAIEAILSRAFIDGVRKEEEFLARIKQAMKQGSHMIFTF